MTLQQTCSSKDVIFSHAPLYDQPWTVNMQARIVDPVQTFAFSDVTAGYHMLEIAKASSPACCRGTLKSIFRYEKSHLIM